MEKIAAERERERQKRKQEHEVSTDLASFEWTRGILIEISSRKGSEIAAKSHKTKRSSDQEFKLLETHWTRTTYPLIQNW